LHVLDKQRVNSLAGDWLEFHDFRDMIAGLVNVRIAEHDKRPAGWTPDEFHRRFKREGAGRFRSDKSARDVETVFGKQIRQVVAGDAARNVGITPANLIAMVIGQIL